MPQIDTIRITRTPALIGIEQRPSTLQIQSTRSNFEMKTKPARVLIEREPLILSIDSTQTRAEMGVKSTSQVARELTAAGLESALEGIGRIAAEGNRMAAIESRRNAIADIAAAALADDVDYNVGLIPETPPSISITGGRVRIDVEPGQVQVRATAGKPEIVYQPGSVEVYLRQKPSLTIEVEAKEK